MGVKLMPLPEEPFIRFAGRLSDQERLQALEARDGRRRARRRTRACRCSRWNRSRSARRSLANARSEVLVDHCHKSNAGLHTTPTATSSASALRLLMADAPAEGGTRAQRPRVRAPELPVGCDPEQLRKDVRAAAGTEV